MLLFNVFTFLKYCIILKFCNMNLRKWGVSVHTYICVYVIHKYMRLGIQKLAVPVEA